MMAPTAVATAAASEEEKVVESSSIPNSQNDKVIDTSPSPTQTSLLPQDSISAGKPQEIAFTNEATTTKIPPTTNPLSPLNNRNESNQSTIESGLSRNSHLDNNDPNIRRMFGLSSASNTHTERHRRLRLLMDQCETVRFPFKKRLILANMNLSQDEIPVEQICGDTLGMGLYKLSLAGNRLHTIPEPLIVKLTGLRILDFSQCDLCSIPEQWDLPSLRKLNLSHNKIKECLSEVRNSKTVACCC